MRWSKIRISKEKRQERIGSEIDVIFERVIRKGEDSRKSLRRKEGETAREARCA